MSFSYKQERAIYKKILRNHVSTVKLRHWPWNYYCGLMEKHKPDVHGREYDILLNRTRGKECGKHTLIHELIHIRDDLEERVRSDSSVEEQAQNFYEKNRRFVSNLWKKYMQN